MTESVHEQLKVKRAIPKLLQAILQRSTKAGLLFRGSITKSWFIVHVLFSFCAKKSLSAWFLYLLCYHSTQHTVTRVFTFILFCKKM